MRKKEAKGQIWNSSVEKFKPSVSCFCAVMSQTVICGRSAGHRVKLWTPEEHCITLAANQNIKFTHSRASAANQSSSMDRLCTEKGSKFLNKYTVDWAQLPRERNQISSGHKNGQSCSGDGCQRRRMVDVDREKSVIEFLFFFLLPGYVRLGDGVSVGSVMSHITAQTTSHHTEMLQTFLHACWQWWFDKKKLLLE